jgi:alkylhydroperoxidase family enzyme
MDDATATQPWRDHAPEAFDVFDHVEALAASAVEQGILGPVRRAVASQLCNPAELERTPAPGPDVKPDARSDVCVLFAEQFVVDVSGITDAQRSALWDALGDATVPFVQALYVVDMFQRGRITLARLYDAEYGPALPPATGDLWAAIEEFLRVVARGSALDPLTTEIVRLRGARAHHCRICQSRLSVRALDSAGDQSPFDAIDDYEHSELSERHKVALRLTDAIITQPAFIDRALVEQVRKHFAPAEQTEIVLDVTRNAANKFAVALGGDEAQVAEGIEFFDVDASGEVVASTDMEAVRAATA